MIFNNETWEENIKSMARTVRFTVTTEGVTYSPTDKIISVVIDKVASNSKLFGYTITRKATIELIDSNNDLHFNKGSEVIVTVTEPVAEANFYPSFYIDEIIKDDTGKRVTITAYDALAYNGGKSISELEISYPITIAQLQTKIKDHLNIAGVATASTIAASYTEDEPINAIDENSILQLVEALAEATGTIAFINENNILQFWLPPENDEYIIDKSQYFNLVLSEAIELSGVIKSNDLGDNIIYGDKDKYYQTLKNNMFLDNLNDSTSVGILQQIYNQWNGTVYTPITLEYRGNPAFSTAQVVQVDTIKNGMVKAIYGAETLTYNGGLKCTSEWMPEEPEEEEQATSASDIVNSMIRTSAKVDKLNNKIELSVQDLMQQFGTSLTMTTDSITANIGQLEQDAEAQEKRAQETEESLNTVSGKTNQLESDVNDITDRLQTLEDSQNTQQVLENTTVSLTQAGITVGKSNSAATTNISDNGMIVKYNDEVQLTANSQGVIANDLKANNYLIIDNKIRFQVYNTNRIGCFWIGG